MKKLKWQTEFQLFMIIIGLSIGIHFSIKAHNNHDDLHVAQVSHSNMDHGYIDISNDSIIPKIEQVKLFKDPVSGWNVHIITSNFLFTPENAGSKHKPGHGHAHLMINGVKTARVYSNWFHLPAMEYPIEEIEVTLNANCHAIMSYNKKPIALKTSQLGSQ